MVASLQHQTTASAIEAFEAPISPLGGRLHRSRSHISSTPVVGARNLEVDPLDDSLGHQMLLGSLNGDSSSSTTRPSIPAILVHSIPSRSSSIDDVLHVPPTQCHRMLRTLKNTSLVLFPHLHNFPNKSVLSILVAIFATPGILAFTITIPVVITAYGETNVPKPDETTEARLIDFEEDGIERVLVAEDELKEECYETQFNKWLTALQCALGPVFCVLVLFGIQNFLFVGTVLI